tara:strand:- start:3 stop:986 length:984 start_codon:yes stop_codon:yes gene_type:complete
MALTKVIGAGLGTVTSADLDGAVTINESSADKDFRVESDDNTHALFLEGSTGNIGIGTSSPTNESNLVGITLDDTSGSFVDLMDSGTRIATFRADVNAVDISTLNASFLRFKTNNNEIMRITSSGTIGIGDSTPTAFVDIAFDTQQAHTLQLRNSNSSAGGGKYIQFAKANGDFTGSVTQSSDQNTVAFNTSSDYRLKENVSYDFDATSRLKQLKPARFNWISDENNTTIDGFIAHEVSGIVPEAITGEKDGTQDVGTIKDKDDNVLHTDVPEIAKQDGETWTKTGTKNVYQGIDQSKLVPLLTKALQEQQATIEALTARITALENA